MNLTHHAEKLLKEAGIIDQQIDFDELEIDLEAEWNEEMEVEQ